MLALGIQCMFLVVGLHGNNIYVGSGATGYNVFGSGTTG